MAYGTRVSAESRPDASRGASHSRGRQRSLERWRTRDRRPRRLARAPMMPEAHSDAASNSRGPRSRHDSGAACQRRGGGAQAGTGPGRHYRPSLRALVLAAAAALCRAAAALAVPRRGARQRPSYNGPMGRGAPTAQFVGLDARYARRVTSSAGRPSPQKSNWVFGVLLANQDTELTKSQWVESERALLRLFKHRERNERKGGTRKALD